LWRHDGGPHHDGGARRRRACGCERGVSRRRPGRRSRRRGSTTRRNEAAAGPPPGASPRRLQPSVSLGSDEDYPWNVLSQHARVTSVPRGINIPTSTFSPRRAAPSPPPPPSPPSAYDTISAASAVATAAAAAERPPCEAIPPASNELFLTLGNPPPCPCRGCILAARRPHNTPSTDHLTPPAPRAFPSSCSPRAGGFRGAAGGRSNGDARHTSGRDGIGSIVRCFSYAECTPRVGANTKGVSRSLSLCSNHEPTSRGTVQSRTSPPGQLMRFHAPPYAENPGVSQTALQSENPCCIFVATPRHRMLFNWSNKGTKRVSMTWQAT